MGIIELYTLPTCPICKVIKTKLDNLGYAYEEKSFEELPDYIKEETDRAPVLFNGDAYLYSPSDIIKWIEAV